MHKHKEKEKRKSMHFFLILFLYLFTLLILTRDLKRGKEVHNNKKVSFIITIPEGIFISLFDYSLTRFLFLFLPALS